MGPESLGRWGVGRPEDETMWALTAMLGAMWFGAPDLVWHVEGEDCPELAPFDEAVRACMEERHVSRAALAVTRNGRLVLAHGYTWAPPGAEATRPESLFRIASVSKPITATAVLQLVEAGAITLDQPIGTILDLDDAVDEQFGRVTVRQLLHHWGGWDRGMSFDPMFQDFTIRDALGISLPTTPRDVIAFMKTQPLDYAPGEREVYSNFGYCILGRVIEAASGESYEDYVRARVFAPIGVDDARVGRSARDEAFAGEVDYEGDEGDRVPTVLGSGSEFVPPQYGGWNVTTMDAHGGWVTSAVSLVRFAAAFDDPEHCPLLSAASIETMWEDPPWGEQGADVHYGCGWMVRRVTGGTGRNTWHAGLLIPGATTLLVRRNDGLNWALLFNNSYTPSDPTPAADYDAMLHVAASRVRHWPEGR